MLIKHISLLVTQNSSRSILQHVDLRIEKGRITEIAPHLPGAPDIDGSGKAVLPGLVNTHTHIGMTGLRGFCDDKQLPEWLEQIIPAEKSIPADQCRTACTLACKEMLQSGTTTFAEMYWPAEPVIDAAQASGLRAVVFPTFFEQFDCSNRFEIMDALRNRTTERITIGIGAHSLYGCSKELLTSIARYATTHHIPCAIHVAETRKERFDALHSFGALPIEYLASLGFLSPHTLLVHCIWLTKGEIQTIKKFGAHVSHCPVSNMKLASGGVMPLPEMHQQGIMVGLGTDSVASNNCLDLFGDMKVAGLLHKHHRWDARVLPVQKILDMATIDGAHCLGLQNDIGSIEIGKKADLITIDVEQPNMQPVHHLLSNIVYSANGTNVADVIIDGELRMNNRSLTR